MIGFGGNVGPQTAILERFSHARSALAELGALRSAPLYRSAPIGPAQPAYLNTAIQIALVAAQPAQLFATLQELERRLGRTREREVHWGPRPIDLDVLVWGTRQLRAPELEVPHPRLGERKFALAPLVALLGDDFAIPGLGAAGARLALVATQSCDELAEVW